MIDAAHLMHPTPMTPPEAISQLRHDLPGVPWITDPGRVARLSQDFSWFSPVLKRQLEGRCGDLAVRPSSEADLLAVVAACARRRVPITLRGSGTGNYGQSTPLAGGLILDMTELKAVHWVRPGVARAQAGIRLGELEKQLVSTQQELRCMPSTFRSATLGGLYGGGFGGIGSVNVGPLASAGNVLGLRAVTVEAEPRVVELRGAEALSLHHRWGTNGIVLDLEIGLAPAHPWLDTIATFATFDSAIAFADELARAPGIVKREVAVFSAQVLALLPSLQASLPAGCHGVLAIVAESGEEPLRDLIAAHDGRLSDRRNAEEARAIRRSLAEYTWNHTTLHALKVDPTLTYLQCAYEPGVHLAQVRAMEALFAGEVLAHLEFIRTTDGRMTCSGLPLVRYTSEARLNEIMAIHRQHGIGIHDPHINVVDDGRSDDVRCAAAARMKDRFDPLGLLNPGKLRDWPADGRVASRSASAEVREMRP